MCAHVYANVKICIYKDNTEDSSLHFQEQVRQKFKKNNVSHLLQVDIFFHTLNVDDVKQSSVYEESIFLKLYFSISSSVCLSGWLSVSRSPLSLSVCVCLFVFLCFCLSISMRGYLPLYICLLKNLTSEIFTIFLTNNIQK